MELILNEIEWVEEALKHPGMQYRNFGALLRYSKYLHSKGYNKKDMRHELELFMARCDPSVNLFFWQDVLDKVVKNADARPLIVMDGVRVTENEFARIAEIRSWMSRRLLFTLLCVAKYMNAVRETNANWVNLDTKELFRLANVKTSAKRQALMLNDLWSAGYIGFSRVIDNTNINVKIVDEDDSAGILIGDMRNIGNRYMLLKGTGYMECEECGLAVKKNSNVQKYCSECAGVVHLRRSAG